MPRHLVLVNNVCADISYLYSYTALKVLRRFCMVQCCRFDLTEHMGMKTQRNHKNLAKKHHTKGE